MEESTDWRRFPGLPFAFSFEKNFDVEYHVKWYFENWSLTLYASITYLVLVFVGVKLMEKREPFKLKLPLTLWSLSLSIFSIMAATRLVPTSLLLIRTKGFMGSAIDGSYNNDIRVKCWTWLFTISKVPEFADTFFIVGRKQKLIFLHWYHHFITAPFCAILFPEMSGVMIHYQAMNATVHSIMYSYYTLKAIKVSIHSIMYSHYTLKPIKVRIPSGISMAITTSQIIQMILGTVWSGSLLINRISGEDVNQSYRSLIAAVIMYLSYLILFLNFFIHSYLRKSPVNKTQVNGTKKD